jgi:hypothetical protein
MRPYFHLIPQEIIPQAEVSGCSILGLEPLHSDNSVISYPESEAITLR